MRFFWRYLDVSPIIAVDMWFVWSFDGEVVCAMDVGYGCGAEGGGFEPPKVSLTSFPSLRTRPLCDPSCGLIITSGV